MGDPVPDFKKWTHELLLKEKQEKARQNMGFRRRFGSFSPFSLQSDAEFKLKQARQIFF